MQIGITGVEIDSSNKDVQDLIKYIKASGNTYKIIYSDTLGVNLKSNKSQVYHTHSRPSGSGADTEMLAPDGIFLRHIGIIRDYEQLTFRLWCIKAFELNGAVIMNQLNNWLLASDKLATSVMLAKHGLPIPDTVATEQMFNAYDAAKEFKSSVVKPLRSAMGFGVFKIDDADVGMHIFSYFADINKPIYVQKYIEKKNGGDYRVIIVGDEVVGAEFRKGKTWKSNVSQGAIPMKTKIDDEMKELAIKTGKVMGLDYGGIDIADTKDGYFIIETNPTLSWQGFKSVTGINPAKNIVEHMLKKLKN